jgi:hypothetical protein
MNEYEVFFTQWNMLTKKHDERYDYFKADSEDLVRSAAYWKYGDLIDIIHVISLDYC